MVYLALANFRRKIPFRHLPSSLQADIKTFFGSYQRALGLGREKLFALGQPGAVAQLCEEFEHGWQDEHSLYIHRTLIEDLPAELRVLLGCAEILEGDLSQADIIKIHKQSSKVTLLMYQDFDRRSFPQLIERIKINLADQSVQYFRSFWRMIDRRCSATNIDLLVRFIPNLNSGGTSTREPKTLPV